MTGRIVLGERSERPSFSSSTKLTGEIEDDNENDDEDDRSAHRGCARNPVVDFTIQERYVSCSA